MPRKVLHDRWIEPLIQKAIDARQYAYMPYSGFAVGAALLTKGGKVFSGCNVENASYGLTLCAERVALFKAISEGERSFQALAVVADTEKPISPCGACRQVLVEFQPDLTVVMSTLTRKVEITQISALLPNAFRKPG